MNKNYKKFENMNGQGKIEIIKNMNAQLVEKCRDRALIISLLHKFIHEKGLMYEYSIWAIKQKESIDSKN